tara:strand:- start:20 stop:292 length:273 start_codon:yes stop_codon:yes gene_type:complete
MRDIIRILVTLVLVVIISILPSLSNKNKFKIKLAVSGMINKIIIFSIVCLATLEDKVIGLLLLILTFSALNLNISKENHIEGFTNYYKGY